MIWRAMAAARIDLNWPVDFESFAGMFKAEKSSVVDPIATVELVELIFRLPINY